MHCLFLVAVVDLAIARYGSHLREGPGLGDLTFTRNGFACANCHCSLLQT